MDLTNINLNKRIDLDQDFNIDLSIYKHKSIKDLKDLHVKGFIYNNDIGDLIINLDVTGIIILEDSVTLENISKEINIKITEEDVDNSDYLDNYYKNSKNTLDIIGILWENIVLEVPIRISNTDNVSLSGNCWSYGEQNIKKDNIDPRLAKLQELYKD